MWKNIEKPQGNNKLKISRTTKHEEFEILGGSYPISDIHDIFE